MPPASTPCIRVCTLDGPLCLGCGRTLDEIGAWSRLSEAERLAIMALLPARLAGDTGAPGPAAAPGASRAGQPLTAPPRRAARRLLGRDA